MIQCFTCYEIHVGLGITFRELAYTFLEALEMAEMDTGYRWAERIKVNKLGRISRGTQAPLTTSARTGHMVQNQPATDVHARRDI